jgi:hypothetical protein
MKRAFAILVLSLVVSICWIGKAHAIVVDGIVDPSDEWDTWFIRGTDPNEPSIADDYDIEVIYAWWDDFDVYLRTDVYGVPTLAKQDPGNFTPTFYQWTVDTTGDEAGDLKIVLESANQDGAGNDRVALYLMDNTFLGYGPAVLDDIVEASFSISLLENQGIDPDSIYDVAGYVRLDNAGEDPDDRLPDTGWAHTIPEPSSMLLLGIGIFGLASGTFKKRFTA